MILQQFAIYLFCGAICLAGMCGLWLAFKALGLDKEFEQKWD